MMNSSKARSKKSDVERKTDKYIVLLVIIQTIICLIAGIIYSFWESVAGSSLWYLNDIPKNAQPAEVNVIATGATSFGTWFLVMMNFVPISLIVCLEMVKFF